MLSFIESVSQLMSPVFEQFIYNTDRTTVVSYDDTYSIESKTKFAKKSGMAGCFTWSMEQVRNTAVFSVVERFFPSLIGKIG